MDTDQQIRFNFLDEANDCCDRIEASILGISETIADRGKIDLALRSSHSVKGGAAMMGFPALSQSAHRLEDFFKVLRVRFTQEPIEVEVEQLLLQSVDRLRDINTLYRQSERVEDTWLKEYVTPVYEKLHDKLGILELEEENQLLFQSDEGEDPALMIFKEAIEPILDEFETDLPSIAPDELPKKLISISQELVAFGHMAELENFIELCDFIQQQAIAVLPEQAQALTHATIATWRRAHALVVVGRNNFLPTVLDHWEPIDAVSSESVTALPDSINFDLDEDLTLDDDLLADFSTDLDLFDHELDLPDSVESPPILSEELISETLEITPDLAEDETRVETPEAVTEYSLDEQINPFVSLAIDEVELADLRETFDLEIENLNLEPESEVETAIDAPTTSKNIQVEVNAQNIGATPLAQTDKTVRVSANQLYQFNTLFSKLVLERNSILLRFEQLEAYAEVMKSRIAKLSISNNNLRKWYDQASTEGVIPKTLSGGTESPVLSINPAGRTSAINESFDALEMDQYSDLHLISQDQIETVVQLQEVSSDIDLSLRAMGRSVKDLNQTTQLLQKNVTRTQMAPFSTIVKPFPRVIRDLNFQSGKSVRLNVEGDTTLIDRAILETLGDAILHLLRNAYDHGIETPEVREQAGKAKDGLITIRAENRSTQTIISLIDDGAGINLEKIRSRLINLGLESPLVEEMAERELMDFIFEPGFSTASEVTELSGRGVGMDLVRSNLTEIRGDISVSSERNVGTTFTLRVPYNLSIMKVMLLERSGITFAVPVDNVRDISIFQDSTRASEEIVWQNQSIPIIDLEKYFRFSRPGQSFKMSGSPRINYPSYIVTGNDNILGALTLDRFWGEQEVTVRPVSDALNMPPGFVSSLILGDGRVLPLIDPVQLLEWCLAQEPIEHQEFDRSQSQLSGREASPQKSILIVDDSINVRRYLALTLEKAGYIVEQARDGQDGVDRLNDGLSVQAVICDIEMPRLDGYGFLEQIRGQAKFQNLPIVMLTSRSNEKHRKIAISLGATDYVSKPYDEGELLARLSELVTVPVS